MIIMGIYCLKLQLDNHASMLEGEVLFEKTQLLIKPILFDS